MHRAIEHVVVVMLENRSFDNLLGYLYGPSDLPRQNLPALRAGDKPFHGLLFEDSSTLENDSVPPAPVVRAANSPGWDPGEEYEHVNVQLFGENSIAPDPTTGQWPTPAMKGFLKDYSTLCNGDAEAKQQIMHMYTAADVPVISALAKAYAVSDMWFASVPTQTNANRAFSLCGTSLGLVDNGFLTKHWIDAKFANDRFDTDTICNVLERNGFSDWKIFWEVPYPPKPLSDLPYTRNLFPHLEAIANIGSHFEKLDDFFALAKAGTLPKYSYIEPHWGGYIIGMSAMGDEYHPPSDTTPGEHLLQRIYASLRDGACWENTLLVITFDEHGGTYDHVPPGAATPPTGERVKGQHDFTFDRFGVRVPTILVSPYIDQGTVFRSESAVPYDHTSVIATVLSWALPNVGRENWGLGERVANAPLFGGVLTLDAPRKDDALAPIVPTRGTPLKYGDSFYLRHMSGDFVMEAYSGKRYYYPRLGRTGAVPLSFRYGMGAVQNNAVVQLRTSEYLEPKSDISPYFANYVAIRNVLGAWEDDHDCYYYSTDDAKDFRQQYWKLTRKDAAAEPTICHGDRVYLSSEFQKYRDQRLVKDNQYLTSMMAADEWWSVEPDTKPSENSTGVIQFGEPVYLRNMSGESIGPHDRSWPKLVTSNFVTLRLSGGVGDVTDGATVNIETTESGLAPNTILGAFADSHDCYYWTSGYKEGRQDWRIRKVDGGDAGVRHGDKVYIESLSSWYRDQKLARDTHYAGYVTTLTSSKEWWTVEMA